MFVAPWKNTVKSLDQKNSESFLPTNVSPCIGAAVSVEFGVWINLFSSEVTLHKMGRFFFLLRETTLSESRLAKFGERCHACVTVFA